MNLSAWFLLIKDVDGDRGTRFGQLATVPLSLTKQALVQVGISPDLPPETVVTTANLVITPKVPLTGARTLTLRRNTAAWKTSKATWNAKPAVAGSGPSTTGSSGDATLSIDVLSDVQAFISGTLTNYGWRLWDTDTTTLQVRGATAAEGRPYLELEYALPGDPPWDQVPNGGAVSISKPVLTFATAGDVTAIQVQIDAGNNFTSGIDFDSGTVTAVAGELDLTTTAYAGLSAGATTYWRARYQTAAGWTDYSEVATFTRTAKPTVTITAPAATTGDKTPPVDWTVAGGTQAVWQVLVYNGATLVANSGRTAGTVVDWTPEDNVFNSVGQVRRFVVRVWDAVDREVTPGDPTYSEAHIDVTLVSADTAAGVDTLTATTVYATPGVQLVWTATSGDQWEIVRGNKWLDRIDGARRSYTDYEARPYAEHTYKVLRVTGSDVSPNGPTALGTPRPIGIWLLDTIEDDATGEHAVIFGDDPGEWSMTEQAVIHQPVGDAAPVRRRSGILPPSGSLAGVLTTGLGVVDVDEVIELLYSFKINPAGYRYRLVVGDWSIPVTIGDLQVNPLPASRDERLSAVSFNWWQTRSNLPWPT